MNPVPARSVPRVIPRLPETRHNPWPHITTLTLTLASLTMLGGYIFGGTW
jgi:hypothetical protein